MTWPICKHSVWLSWSILCPAVKEAAVQRRHNLYRDSIILTNSDPNLHLLGDNPSVDWATKFGGEEPEGSISSGGDGGSGRRRRQVVSMIQLDGVPLPYESCLEVPGVELIPEEDAEVSESTEEDQHQDVQVLGKCESPKSPDSVDQIRGLINPVVEMVLPKSEGNQVDIVNGTEPASGTVTLEDGVQEEVTCVTTVVEDVSRKSPQDETPPQSICQQLVGSENQEMDEEHQEEAGIKSAIEDIEIEVQEGDSERIAEVHVAESDSESSPQPPSATDSSPPADSGFQSPNNELDEANTNGLNGKDRIINPVEVEVVLA